MAATWRLEYENFNAAGAKIIIKGVSVHTGYAKGKMVNSNDMAVEFQNMIPENETPEQTEGYQVSTTSSASRAAAKRQSSATSSEITTATGLKAARTSSRTA